MDFARKILQSYGWKDGDGLGKNKNGISKPLKAALKFDKSGFGADQAAVDFNNHWWERVFNEAAANINITEGKGVKMGLKADDGVEISTKCYSLKKLKKIKNTGEANKNKSDYENFLQTSTLTNVGIENPNEQTRDIEISKTKYLTDEELFKACGGRTAHKGARHGLKLNGKLSRIEKQEAELLAKMVKHSGFAENNIFNAKRSESGHVQEKIKTHAGLKIKEEKLAGENDGTVKKKKRKHYKIESAENATNEDKDVIDNEKICNKNSKICNRHTDIANLPKKKKKNLGIKEEITPL